MPELRADGERHESLRDAARIEAGLRSFLEDGGFMAFTDTFEDLGELPQLPGIAVQRLLADGYGFGAEGDWKTAALVRVAKVMSTGLEGGSSFMEDYTYHLAPEGPKVLGAHMLEVCPSIAGGKPRCEIHPLSIGGKEDPVRLVFTAGPGPAVVVGLLDLGDRFRLVLNEVDVVEPAEELPRLPVARALWEPRPDLATAAEAWLVAGGPHHTAFCRAIGREAFADLAEIAGIELLVIDEQTRMADFAKESAGTRRTSRPSGRLMALDELRERVFEANRQIVEAGLVVLTFGNASAVDRAAGVMAIKPSGVPYAELGPDSMVVVDLESGEVRRGIRAALLGHADTPRALPRIRRDRRDRPHAFPVRDGVGPGPPGDPLLRHDARRPLPRARAGDPRAHRRGDRWRHERCTGDVIVETVTGLGLGALERPAVLVASHGPFAWGPDAGTAVENAIALEVVAESAFRTEALAARRRADRSPSCSTGTSCASTGPARTTASDREGSPPPRHGRSSGSTTSRCRSRATARYSCA